MISYSPIQTADQDIQLIQANIQKAVASLQTYAAAPANWATPAPATIQAALDRMASLLKTLNGGNAIP